MLLVRRGRTRPTLAALSARSVAHPGPATRAGSHAPVAAAQAGEGGIGPLTGCAVGRPERRTVRYILTCKIAGSDIQQHRPASRARSACAAGALGGCRLPTHAGSRRYLDVKIPPRDAQDDPRDRVEDHLHPHRRGARCWRRTPSSRSSRRTPPRPVSTWRPATSRWRAGSSPSFADRLPEDQRVPDALAELGDLAKTPEANIIKLPNISASIPQLKAADRRAPGAGLRAAGLPRQPADRRGEGRPRPLRQGQGQRGQPGAARGQLRPSRAGVGEELRPQAPALDGRVEPPTPRPTSRT